MVLGRTMERRLHCMTGATSSIQGQFIDPICGGNWQQRRLAVPHRCGHSQGQRCDQDSRAQGGHQLVPPYAPAPVPIFSNGALLPTWRPCPGVPAAPPPDAVAGAGGAPRPHPVAPDLLPALHDFARPAVNSTTLYLLAPRRNRAIINLPHGARRGVPDIDPYQGTSPRPAPACQ